MAAPDSNAPYRYDVVPYPSKAYAHAHPDRLYVLGSLFGLEPPHPSRARVLELACGEGGHLLPMAVHHPEARLVGIDLSTDAIDKATAAAESLGLTDRVTLRQADILDLGEDLGTFDYILAHGVFSWVPAPVREKILQICHDHLTPSGLAYISYNTLPGWHMQRVARTVLQVHAERFSDPLEQVQQGAALLRFLADAVGENQAPYAVALRHGAKQFDRYSDAYAYHDFLSDVNDPLLFKDFAAMAHRHGLDYVGDAIFGEMLPTGLPPHVKRKLDKLAPTLLEMEQYGDLLRGRTFRRSVLCHAGRPMDRELTLDDLSGLRLGFSGNPLEEHADVSTDEPARFETLDEVKVTVGTPVGKAALFRLLAEHPRTLSLEELRREAIRWAGVDGDDPSVEHALSGTLLHAFGVGLVPLSPPGPLRYVPELSERPEACPYARWMASHEAERATNRRHEMVMLTNFDRELLTLLDGTRDQAALLEGLQEAVAEGRLVVRVDEVPTTDQEIIDQALEAALPDRLERLLRSALLVG